MQDQTGNNGFSRRWFIGGACALGAMPGIGLVLPSGGRADIRFGVVSDVHLRFPGDEDTLFKAFGYFRDHGVDAVLIAGDISDGGYLDQLAHCGKSWRKVFPGDKAPDGRHVEKLFIYGNHDIEYGGRKPGSISPDRAAAWEKVFGEKYEPIWMKTVKGFTFIGAHWGEIGKFPEFLKAHAAEINRKKPFFYTQHAHPKDTVMGAWAWGHDDGLTTKALSAFPNAVTFSGHSHYTLTDERSVWQGAFTSINTSSLRYASCDYSLRENLKGNRYGFRGEKRPHVMPQIDTNNGRQGMLVSVYGNTLVIERREFVYGKSLGDDWVLTVPCAGDNSFAARKAKRVAPAFAPNAKAAVKVEKDTLTVSFPAARTVKKCRVYEYEVTATLVEDGVDLVQAQRRVMANDFHLPESPEGRPGTCVFKLDELPIKGRYRFAVRPVECFGLKGAPLVVAATVG